MSLDKAILYGKEKRIPYTGAKAVATSCRNNGSDDWSRDDRLYQQNKADESSKQKLKEFLEDN